MGVSEESIDHHSQFEVGTLLDLWGFFRALGKKSKIRRDCQKNEVLLMTCVPV